MDTETLNALTQIASSIGTNVVLLLWLMREIRQADTARLRLQEFHDEERQGRQSKERDSLS